MNIARFIAVRLIREDEGTRMSRPIVRIATAGISVGMVLMILSIAVVRGFQREVREKVIGFGSHFQVVGNEDGRSRESSRLPYEPHVVHSLARVDGVRHVQVFAVKPGILETREALQGVIVKGAGADFDWNYLRSVMEKGDILRTASGTDPATEIIVSRRIADRLRLDVGSRVSLYFVQSQSDARQQNFTVKGIYRTDLEDFDRQYVFVDIAFIQKYSGWGLDAQILCDTACQGGMLAFGAIGFGGEGELAFSWPGQPLTGEGPFYLVPDRDTSFTVVVSDEADTRPDTATLVVDMLDDASVSPCRPFRTFIREGVRSESAYVGGYEVLIDDYDALFAAGDAISAALPFYLSAIPVTDRNPDIFSWLEMLDINVVIIIVLMVAISIINMTSALLIIILERQGMIGTLKAFGIRDGAVMRIFLIQAAWIIGRGLLWGNVVGLVLVAIQHFTGIIRLDPVNYYVDHVPVWLDAWVVLGLNASTMVVCVVALVLPALYVTSISPIRAIRFS